MWKFKLYIFGIVVIMFSTTSIDIVNYLCNAKTTIAILEEENHNAESEKNLINEKCVGHNVYKLNVVFFQFERKSNLVYFLHPLGNSYVYVIDFPPEFIS